MDTPANTPQNATAAALASKPVSPQAEDRRLRRIFAQGFTAAERLTDAQRRVVAADGSTSFNPHTVEPERTHWAQGFDRARSNNGRPPAKAKPFGRKGTD